MKRFHIFLSAFQLFSFSAFPQTPQTTPVLFDVATWSGTAQNRSLLIAPVNNWLTDNTNIFVGPALLAQPTNGSALVHLVPNDYQVQVQGVSGVITIRVPLSTNTLNASTLTTNLTTYTWTSPAAPWLSQLNAKFDATNGSATNATFFGQTAFGDFFFIDTTSSTLWGDGANITLSGGDMTARSFIGSGDSLINISASQVGAASTNLIHATGIPTTVVVTNAGAVMVPFTGTNLVPMDSQGRVYLTGYTNENNRFAAEGSSTAAGAGTSAYSNSWFARYSSQLTAGGIICSNFSISGTTTTSNRTRLFYDVINWTPGSVALATAAGNDGVLHDPSANWLPYLTNTLIMHRALKSRGITTSVGYGIYARNTSDSWGAASRAAEENLLDQFEALGFRPIDFATPTFDVTNGVYYRPGIAAVDNTHPNDLGHSNMFWSLSPSTFGTEIDRGPSQYSIKAWQSGTNGPYGVIQTRIPDPMGNWTVACWVKDSGSTNDNIAFLSVGALNMTRHVDVLSYQGKYWVSSLSGGPYFNTGVTSTNREWHHIAVTHDWLTTNVTFYCDGAAKANAIGTESKLAQLVEFLGIASQVNMATNVGFASPLIYRTCLTSDKVRQLYLGHTILRGCEVFGPLDQSEGSLALVNYGNPAIFTWILATNWTCLGEFKPSLVTPAPVEFTAVTLGSDAKWSISTVTNGMKSGQYRFVCSNATTLYSVFMSNNGTPVFKVLSP